jgi:fatty acid desaturase
MTYQASEAANLASLDQDMAGRGPLSASELRPLSRRSDLRGALQFGAHLGCMSGTAMLVWLARPYWWLVVPAMALHGVTIVTLFAPMHECVHRTAFASRRANDIVGWVAGVLSFYNSTFYRHFHAWHHRYTQDPARDPELMTPKADSRWRYFKEITGINFWVRRAIDYPALALGRTRGLLFVPDTARRSIALSMSLQLLVYMLAVVSLVLGSRAVLYYWFLPLLLAQPFLRALLIVEHTGCSQDRNGLTNTRTTLTGFPIRLLMWNMPYHADHHLYPAVPFHRLPALHRQIRGKLAHIAPSYRAANRAVIQSL